MPAPDSIREDRSRRLNEGTKSQKERLFMRGKDISAQPSIKGSNQLPKPPMAIGITIKKIMTKA